MKKYKKLLENKYTAYTVATCSAVLLYVVLTHVGIVYAAIQKILYYIAPFLAGLAIAYLLNPVVTFLANKCFGKIKKRHIARVIAVIITVLVLLGLLALFIFSVIPSLISSIESLVGNADTYIKTASGWLSSLEIRLEGHDIDLSEAMGSLDGVISNGITWVTNNISTILSTSYKIGNGVLNAFISFVIAIYILLDINRMKKLGKRLEIAIFKEPTQKKLNTFFKYFNQIMIRYFGCNILDALIIGAANCLFLTIFGMPYVMLLTFVAAISNLIPTFGPIVGVVISDIVLLFVNPWYALWFTVWTIVVQTLDAYLIKPIMYKGSMGLPAVWVLVSIVIGGRMFGLLGVILAVPTAAIISIYIEKLLSKRLLKRKEGTKTEARAEEDSGNAPE